MRFLISCRVFSACILLFFIFPSFLFSAEEKPERARYVFLMIGDGMGPAQRAAAQVYLSEMARKGNPVKIKRLVMDEFPVQGLSDTNAYDIMITDSAAAGTALACGKKTRGGIISMTPDASAPLETIAEIARKRGMKVGIISSVSIDHATPACFYSHRPSRNMYYEISMDLASSNFNFFGGGGMKGALPGKCRGRVSPLLAAREKGFTLASGRREFEKLKPGPETSRVIVFDSFLDRDAAMFFDMDRPAGSISLAEFTEKAIDLLNNPKGFFIMVEGGKIDWACHANDAAAAVKDVIAFDKAVKTAYEFYTKHPDQTLIVVTADHECGGMSIGNKGNYNKSAKALAGQKMSYLEFDKRVKNFKRKKTPFKDVLPLIKDTFGFDKLTRPELAELRWAYSMTVEGKTPGGKIYSTSCLPLTSDCLKIMSSKAGIGWTTFAHTGIPVPVSAIGAGAFLFEGHYDNTDIFKKILKAMNGVPAPSCKGSKTVFADRLRIFNSSR